MRYTDVTLLVAPFGFGSLGKGMAIAEEFLRCKFSVKILCDPVARKVVKPSGIPTANYEYREELRLKKLNTKIVISSGDIGTPITKEGIPFIVVDSLFWLRGKWERLPKSDADIYVAQRFFIEPSKDAEIAIGERLKFVDAILPSWALESTPVDDRDLTLIYPGGMRSPVLTNDYQESYLSWIESVVSTATLRSTKAKKIVAVIPPQMLASQAAKRFRSYGTIIEAGANTLGKLLKRSEHLIVAPGIETMLEATALGLSPHYLPAYNGSHIPQLIAYREAGIGDEVCPSYAKELKFLEKDTDWLNKLTVDVSLQNSKRLSDPAYHNEAVARLSDILKKKERILQTYPLGMYGARQIVELAIPFLSSPK